MSSEPVERHWPSSKVISDTEKNSSHRFLAGFFFFLRCIAVCMTTELLKASYSVKHPLIGWKWGLIQQVMCCFEVAQSMKCLAVYIKAAILMSGSCRAHLFLPCAVWLALTLRKVFVVLVAVLPSGKWVWSAPSSHVVGISRAQEFVSLKLFSK